MELTKEAIWMLVDAYLDAVAITLDSQGVIWREDMDSEDMDSSYPDPELVTEKG